jgi:hypothetical protein
MNNHIYDTECCPNVWTMTAKHHESGQLFYFEISERTNDISSLFAYLTYLKQTDARMIGFNNLSYDYPVLHFIINNPNVTAADIYIKSVSIINAPDDRRFDHIIWDSQQIIPQLDLFKIHHFDNKAKTTTLKVLEFNMRSKNIQDLPFPPGQYLTLDEINVLARYNRHDVEETEKFFLASADQIKFREYLTEKYNRNFMNHNDTKIGKDFFIMELEKAIPGVCYESVMGRRRPRQTRRETIAFKDVIFPYVRFDHPEFNRVLEWFKSKVIPGTETKGVIDGLSCEIDGFRFDFGTGGIHGSVESQIVQANEAECILDLDVTSYYPSLAIANRLYPQHLTDKFCDIYADIKKQRVGYAKGTPENTMLKLALNGTFGDTNNIYSPFYDPQYTMAITINGQLLLCMLAEILIRAPGLRLIQINTDGLTVKCNRSYLPWIEQVKQYWCELTGLELEENFYSRFFVRDVNNYLAECENGKVKRKGAYEHKMAWHQNHSALVIPKAVEVHLLTGVPVDDFIYGHEVDEDFMLRTKVPRTARLVLDEQPMQNVTRYYIARRGGALVKIMKPLKGKTADRRIGINVGWKVRECNDLSRFDRLMVDYDFYIQEAVKLIKPLRG